MTGASSRWGYAKLISSNLISIGCPCTNGLIVSFFVLFPDASKEEGIWGTRSMMSKTLPAAAMLFITSAYVPLNELTLPALTV